jgi:putative lipopolysaccharide biosynthesis glycosyltransferase
MIVTASIVTYRNRREILDVAVESFLDTDLDVCLYIIDNSPDDTIRAWYRDPRVKYIFNNSNIGFGAAHNIVMRDLTKLGKYHLVLNPDIRFDRGTIEALYQFMEENSSIGNCMPRIVYPNGNIQYLCKLLPTPLDWIIRMFIPFKKIRAKIDYFFEMRFTGYDQVMDVPYLSGCFMFLRRDVIKEIGVFDEGIFMYGEDTDLNRRIYKRYRTVFFPGVTIVHDFEKGSHKNLRLFWIHVKAAIYYLNKWGWFWDKERARINKEIKQRYIKSN